MTAFGISLLKLAHVRCRNNKGGSDRINCMEYKGCSGNCPGQKNARMGSVNYPSENVSKDKRRPEGMFPPVRPTHTDRRGIPFPKKRKNLIKRVCITDLVVIAYMQHI